MKFTDFGIDGIVKVKPIILGFWSAGRTQQLEINSIYFIGKDTRDNLLFDFYYAPGQARRACFVNEKQFDFFTVLCEMI
jgi:hypothetical protein